jgi:hypothetical protein
MYGNAMMGYRHTVLNVLSVAVSLTFCYMSLTRIHAVFFFFFTENNFSDEATFHTLGNVHRHNARIWNQNNPHSVTEHQCTSPIDSMLCWLTYN